MRTPVIVIAVLVGLVGLVWVLQGSGIIAGSAMSGKSAVACRGRNAARPRGGYCHPGVTPLSQGLTPPADEPVRPLTADGRGPRGR